MITFEGATNRVVPIPLEDADVSIPYLRQHGVALGMNSEMPLGVRCEAVAGSIHPAFLFRHFAALEVAASGTEGIERHIVDEGSERNYQRAIP